jgi:hypothetical protein
VGAGQRKKSHFLQLIARCATSLVLKVSARCVLRCKVVAHLSAERLCSSVKRVLKPDAIRIRHLKVDRHFICAFYPPIRVGYFVYILFFTCTSFSGPEP